MRASPAILLALLLAGAPAARAGDPLTPLYRRAAVDLRAGRPLVVTVHVALCSNQSIWCGNARLGDGDAPRTNLYWGGAAGLRAHFDHRYGFSRVLLDGGDGQVVVERAVYRHRVASPSPHWTRRGVTRPFDVYLVGLAYRGRHIGQAMRRFVGQVSAEAGDTLALAGGPTLAIGASGHVVGYAGHNHLMDEPSFPWPAVTRRAPLGYFGLACMTAQYLGPRLHRPNLHGLLLTTVLMYPGAFTIEGLVRGLARGEPQDAVFGRGADLYARYQKNSPRQIRHLFTHDGRAAFRKAYPRP